MKNQMIDFVGNGLGRRNVRKRYREIVRLVDMKLLLPLGSS